LPETANKKKEKLHDPPKGKEKVESTEFIDGEVMSFQDSPMHGSENEIAEEQQE